MITNNKTRFISIIFALMIITTGLIFLLKNKPSADVITTNQNNGFLLITLSSYKPDISTNATIKIDKIERYSYGSPNIISDERSDNTEKLNILLIAKNGEKLRDYKVAYSHYVRPIMTIDPSIIGDNQDVFVQNKKIIISANNEVNFNKLLIYDDTTGDLLIDKIYDKIDTISVTPSQLNYNNINSSPSLTLTSPTQNQTFTKTGTCPSCNVAIPVAGTVRAGGTATISKVEAFKGTQLMKTLSLPSGGLTTWDISDTISIGNPSTSTFSLVFKATFSDNSTVSSDPISININ